MFNSWRSSATCVAVRVTTVDLSPASMAGGWTITDGQLTLFNPASVIVSRYRRRSVIPNPWTPSTRRLTQPA